MRIKYKTRQDTLYNCLLIRHKETHSFWIGKPEGASGRYLGRHFSKYDNVKDTTPPLSVFFCPSTNMVHNFLEGGFIKQTDYEKLLKMPLNFNINDKIFNNFLMKIENEN